MDFEYSEEHHIYRDSLRKFLDKEIKPLDDKWGDVEMTNERAKSLFKMLVPWGYVGEERVNDWGISCIMSEEMARVFPSLGGCAGISTSTGRMIESRAHADVQAHLASPLINGELIGAVGISEPNVGSDPSSIECRAIQKGDRYIINGTKCWISNGHIAEIVVVVAQTDPAKGPAGIRQFVIDRRETPFESRDIETIGLRAFPTSEMFFDEVEIPETHRLDGWGESSQQQDPAKSFGMVLRSIAAARLGTALISVGIAQRAFEIALKYVGERKQFGKEIGRFQLVQEMIAEMATDIDAARLLSHRAMQLIQLRECQAEVSMAKAYATEMGVRVCNKAIQCMGALGLATESRVERCMRDARMLTIPDGTTQIQNLIIGRSLTGMSAIR